MHHCTSAWSTEQDSISKKQNKNKKQKCILKGRKLRIDNTILTEKYKYTRLTLADFKTCYEAIRMKSFKNLGTTDAGGDVEK